MEKVTRYRCASCGTTWTRSRAQGSKMIPCPSGCAAEHRREVHYCEPGEHDFERVPARGTPPKRCAEHGGGHAGRGLARARCVVCGAACLKSRSQVSEARRGARRLTCSSECRTAVVRGLGSRPLRPKAPVPKPAPVMGLRALFEGGHYEKALANLLRRASITPDGCLVLNGKPYPEVHWQGRSRRMAHRLVLEAVAGRPINGWQAHHVCANPACVSPEHIVPATGAANTAEMLARRTFEAEIANLRAALAEVAPDHPLLAGALG